MQISSCTRDTKSLSLPVPHISAVVSVKVLFVLSSLCFEVGYNFTSLGSVVFMVNMCVETKGT